MKKYALITTYYCIGYEKPSIEYLKTRFNYDGDIEDLYVNFSNDFDPWHKDNLNVGLSGRKDLVYGKIYMLKKFLEDNILGKYEYMCHIDYSDTKFSRSFIEMMTYFENTGDDFIISTEKNCWPPIEVCQRWVDKPLNQEEFTYINSGAFMGKTEICYDYINKMHDLCENTPIDYWDDQGVWQYYHINVNPLNSDNKSKYFFSTANLDESYYYIKDNKIFTKYDTQPYLIHDNSSFSLNLINKI